MCRNASIVGSWSVGKGLRQKVMATSGGKRTRGDAGVARPAPGSVIFHSSRALRRGQRFIYCVCLVHMKPEDMWRAKRTENFSCKSEIALIRVEMDKPYESQTHVGVGMVKLT